MVNGFGFCCCSKGEERSVLPFLANQFINGSELLFAVCDPTNGRDRRLIEDDFSGLDDWIVNGGVTTSGGAVQFPADRGSLLLPDVLAVNAQFQTLVLKTTAASDIANYAPFVNLTNFPAIGGKITLSVSGIGPESTFDSFAVSGGDANPWVAGSLIEIRLVPGPPIQFEYYLNGNLVGSGAFDVFPLCVFISVILTGDDTTSFSDFSLEVLGP